MTRAAVERRTGLGPSALYRAMREGRFPAPFKVGRSAVRCSQREIQAWITALPRSRERAGPPLDGQGRDAVASRSAGSAGRTRPPWMA